MFKYAKLYAKREDDNPDLAFQKELLAIICSFLFLCGIVWWLMWYLIFGWSIPTIAAGLFAILVFSSFVVSHKLRNHQIMVHAVFFGTMIVPVASQWALGSMHNSGMIIAWSFLTPLGVLIFSSLRPALVYMGIFLVCIALTALVEPVFPGKDLTVSEETIRLFYTMNLITSFSVIFATSAWFVHIIKKEKQNSENLLLNILPSDVAQELKLYGKVEPVNHHQATVLFTDFKGFTAITEIISPKELVKEINHCFGAFDAITSKYNIEKIKTIGDSYMAVGGEFGSESCTTADVVYAGLEMQEFITKRQQERKKEGRFYFDMRAGIHSGSVISGVVGAKKFQFDIWGDTVNIASRMESLGEIGKLNISEETKVILGNQFDYKFRGTLPVKGKGDMNMYFVHKKEQQETPEPASEISA